MQALAETLGVIFKDESLITQALTHSSAPTSNHYERLEFMGDRVLNLAIAEMLFKEFNEDEGTMAKRHAALVRQDALVKIAKKWQLAPLLILSPGEERSGGRKKPSILADVVEAVLAVVFLENGYEKSAEIIRRDWGALAKTVRLKDAKSHLQEFLQGQGEELPTYTLVKEEGEAHKMTFTMQVKTNKNGEAEGKATSKQQAEQNAAEALLKQLGEI